MNNFVTDQSAEKKMKSYIRASLPVIQYIDNLYLSRNVVLDWWLESSSNIVYSGYLHNTKFCLADLEKVPPV